MILMNWFIHFMNHIGWVWYEELYWVDFNNYQTVDKQTGQIIYILDPVFNPEILPDEVL